jgi:hypothetical protein
MKDKDNASPLRICLFYSRTTKKPLTIAKVSPLNHSDFGTKKKQVDTNRFFWR